MTVRMATARLPPPPHIPGGRGLRVRRRERNDTVGTQRDGLHAMGQPAMPTRHLADKRREAARAPVGGISGRGGGKDDLGRTRRSWPTCP